jgi:eukaryotic-like serine/threonine-protein kinase
MSDLPGGLSAALADRYRIERQIGAGGMATVYLAYDIRHDRRVAIKVLRAELAAVIGAERFLAEIKTTANLQHPHILPLFDSGEARQQGGGAGTFLFYVMPYVEGESLRALLNREKQLPIGDAVRIATEVASALDYAHRQGVIHRDIKPENILLHDGRALVADFGIALAASKAGGARMTETGMSLGTPHYMSPEQAMGEREISARSDVYALGAMTYEMLVGDPPFTGSTAQAIVAKVISEKPHPIRRARDRVPPVVEDAVLTALEKLPADRFASAAEFSAALTRTDFVPSHGGWTGEHSTGSGLGRTMWRAAPWVIAAAALIALRLMWGRTAESPIGSAPFLVGLEVPPDVVPNRIPSIALSSDGERVVYSAWYRGQKMLFVHEMGELAPRAIPGSEGAARQFLSPDGRWVAFLQNNKLVKLPIDGGTPIELGEAFWGGGAWDEDGRLVYSRSYQEGLWEVPEVGGTPVMLTSPDRTKGELSHWWPQVLPGGENILFTAYRGAGGESTVEVYSRKTKARTVLLRDALHGRYHPAGYLLYANDETILAVPFDLGSMSVKGGAVAVQEDVAMTDAEGYAAYDVTPGGTMAYLPASSFRTALELVFVGRDRSADLALPQGARFDNPRLSPDGRRIAVDIMPPGANSDVWVYPVGSNRGTRITDSPGKDWMPTWTPDGRTLLYVVENPYYEMWTRAADASRPARKLIGGEMDRMPGGISADGRLVSYLANITGVPELRTMALDGSGREQTYLTGIRNSTKPVLSPDGKWMAYESEESGRVEVYIQSFPDPTIGRWKLSSNGASEPLWTRGGREVVFRQRDTVMAVAVDPLRGEIGTPEVLFGGPYVFHAAWDEGRSYDVSADGERFLMMREPGERRRIVVTMNWIEGLKARVTR